MKIEELNPSRWKECFVLCEYKEFVVLTLTFLQVFQVLILRGENDGAESSSIRDGRDLVITDEQFKTFLDHHKIQKSLIPEDNETMKDSYLLLDEDLW